MRRQKILSGCVIDHVLSHVDVNFKKQYRLIAWPSFPFAVNKMLDYVERDSLSRRENEMREV